MIAFTFLILILVGRADGQFCPYNHSNYTMIKFKEITKEVTTTVITWKIIHSYCNLFENLKSWLTTKFNCDTGILQEEKIVAQNRTTVEQYMVYYCCPGYYNLNNSCTYGCPVHKYGVNCTENCSCPSYCDKKSGECICDPGFRGENCSEGCTNGTYGMNCQHTCRCENNSTCNSTDGSCTCTSPGWQGDLCGEECSDNTYGLFCNKACTCNDNQTCDPVNGTCTCKAGWNGKNCSKECDDMTYGINCLNNCTCNRDHTKTCDKITGLCTCRPGYMEEEDCNKECPFGMYGQGCTSSCSDTCINTLYCNPENGTCICLGTHDADCTEDCEPGTYGPDCGWKCSCSNGTSENEFCNNITGQCYCKQGWTGLTCDQEDAGSFSTDTKPEATIFPTNTKSTQFGTSQKCQNISFFVPYISGVGSSVVIAALIATLYCIRRRYVLQNVQRDKKNPETSERTSYYNVSANDTQHIQMTGTGENSYESLRVDRNTDKVYSELETQTGKQTIMTQTSKCI